mmetsp:Transcript_32842/g.44655  ORF Transcript_32842/g.44655 Transcript_32842/m.44655 type:complete len:80 (-) Transcript_32842:47-286(-)
MTGRSHEACAAFGVWALTKSSWHNGHLKGPSGMPLWPFRRPLRGPFKRQPKRPFKGNQKGDAAVQEVDFVLVSGNRQIS